MSTDTNQALLRRIFTDIWDQGDLAAVEDFIAAAHVFHLPGGLDLPGREGYRQVLTLYRTAFPDLAFTIEALYADGAAVIARYRARGTHQGEFESPLGRLAPTGTALTNSTGITINHVAGGQVTESWVEFDNLALLQQLGAIPTAAPTPS